MRIEIRQNLDNPARLEQLYRENKNGFTLAFNQLFPEIGETAIAQVWRARINFGNEEISWGSIKELVWLPVAILIAGFIAKIPDLAGIDPEYFYSRHLAFIVFPFLAAYFAWLHEAKPLSIAIAATAYIFSIGYINMLPIDNESDSIRLACIHLPLFGWAVMGFMFVKGDLTDKPGRLDFLRFNAGLVVMSAIIGIAGGILTAVTFGLFQLIDINVEYAFSHYVVVWGVPAIPLIASYLVRTNPHLVSRVSPAIARLFTPLVLVTLVTYLIALIYTGKDPYNDREFLLIFNLLLIGVMALILFSVSETSKGGWGKMEVGLLLGLSLVTIVVNSIALSAIVFRISEWGITPNRLAVLGANILILANLILVAYRLYKTVKDNAPIGEVEMGIARFLPIYFGWTVFIVFALPTLFAFR